MLEHGLHSSVMAAECVEWLRPEVCRVLVDATAGHGGHALLLALRMAPGSRLLILDTNADSLEIAARRLSDVPIRVVAVQRNHREIADILDEEGMGDVDGVLYDQGLSSADYEGQLGYSFRHDAPLDMRRHPPSGPSAADLLMTLDQRQLTRLFRDFGDETWAPRIAESIVEQRRREPFRTTLQFVKLVERSIPRKAWPADRHVATRAMMALRYAVTDDLGSIRESITAVTSRLRPGGRIACLSFCSTEDRVVKQVFRSLERPCICPKGMPDCGCGRVPQVRSLMKSALRPTPSEVADNPRSRSALLRVVERLNTPTNPPLAST